MINETAMAAEKLESRGVRAQVCKVNELSPRTEQRLRRRRMRFPVGVVVEDTVGTGEWLASHRSGERCASARATASCRTAA